MKYGRFIQDRKRSLIKQLLSETGAPFAFCSPSQISSDQRSTWKRYCPQGKRNTEPSREAELTARVRGRERFPGRPTLENQFFKKAIEHSLKEAKIKAASLTKLLSYPKDSNGVCIYGSPTENLQL
jgi:hypothetical protein